MVELSKKAAVRFEKPGRPANDPISERLRIYRAAGRLILEKGIRRTTIKDVSQAAYLSPGGIYHYFSSKHKLVLYGLEPEALSRACLDAAADLNEALSSEQTPHLADIIDLYVDKNMEMLEFVRPALQAAIELGRPELQRRLAASIEEDADSLVIALRTTHPDLAITEEAAGAIRRTMLGLALDTNITPAEMRRHLLWLFSKLVPDFMYEQEQFL